MKVKKHYWIDFIYWIIITAIILIASGDFLFMEQCDFYSRKLWLKILPFTTILIGYIFVKVRKIRDASFIYYFLIPVFSIIGIGMRLTKILNQRLDEKETIVISAKVNETYPFARYRRTCKFSFEFEGRKVIRKKTLGKSISSKLKVNDTILIEVAKDCGNMVRIYDLFPKTPKLEN